VKQAVVLSNLRTECRHDRTGNRYLNRRAAERDGYVCNPLGFVFTDDWSLLRTGRAANRIAALGLREGSSSGRVYTAHATLCRPRMDDAAGRPSEFDRIPGRRA
jgi:hypothetical protein